MKFIIQSILKILGYEIRRIKPRSEVERGLVIKSTQYHNTRDGMNIFYDDPKLVKNYLIKERVEWYHKVLEICKEKNIILDNTNICDVGCGPGDVLNIIKQNYNVDDLTGLDHSDKAIELGKKRFPEINFKQFDIYSNFKEYENVFDVIFCLEVVEHLLHPQQAIVNMLKMLNRTGAVFITVPDGRPDTYTGHINFWSHESWPVFIESIAQNNFDFDTGLINNKTNFAIIYKK